MPTSSTTCWMLPLSTYAYLQAENAFFNFHFFHMEVTQSNNSSPLSIFLAKKSLGTLRERKRLSHKINALYSVVRGV